MTEQDRDKQHKWKTSPNDEELIKMIIERSKDPRPPLISPFGTRMVGKTSNIESLVEATLFYCEKSDQEKS